ncbi:MAG: RluA family pseudouridine synthase [Eubacteriales bacterium]
MKRRITFEVDGIYDGSTVKSFLRNKLDVSTAVISRLKRTENGITLNDEPVFVTALMRQGDTLGLIFDDETKEGSEIVPVKGEFNKVYEDDDLLVIDKPPYLPVHPTKGHVDDSLANYVVDYYKEQGETFVFRCVNRLDRNTSGLVVIAKNAYTHYFLRLQAEKGKFKKIYTALVHGVLPDSGTIDAPIKRVDAASIKRCVSPDGVRAVTHYTTVARAENLSLAKITLETGRTHQIRVHMAYIGHPLAGDFLYGDENDGVSARQALHLGQIELQRPFTGEKLCFISEKFDFADAIKT